MIQRRWIILLFVVLGIITYANGLGNEMFWDDDDFILKNRFIKDWQYLPLFFSQNLVAGSYLMSNYWRPFLLIVFSMEWHWWGSWVYGWHAVNILVHTLDSTVLFFLLGRLTLSRNISLLIAILFLVHPAHNEAVVYANSLGDSLSTFFVLSSLLLFARFRRSCKPAFLSRNYYFAFLCFPLAIMSKETGFVLCALVTLVDFLIFQANRSFWLRVKKTFCSVWPYLVLALIYVYLRGHILNFNNSFNFYNETNAFTSSILVRIGTFFKAMVQYAGLLFCPYELRVERQLPWAKSPLELDVLGGGILVAVMLACAFYYWKKKPLLSLGLFWFFAAMMPTSNILVPINAVLYEHFLYVPTMGVLIGIIPILARWVGNNHHWQKFSLILFVVIMIIFIGINIRRNTDWKTAIGFYEKLVQYAPSYRVINNLGMAYADHKLYDKSEATYRRSIAMDPANPVAYHNLAGTLRDTGRIKEAIDNFQKALKLNPNFLFSYKSLAQLYLQLGDYKNCRENLLQFLRMDPYDANARQALNFVEEKIK